MLESSEAEGSAEAVLGVHRCGRPGWVETSSDASISCPAGPQVRHRLDATVLREVVASFHHVCIVQAAGLGKNARSREKPREAARSREKPRSREAARSREKPREAAKLRDSVRQNSAPKQCAKTVRQHSAPECAAVRHAAPQCATVRHSAPQCATVRYIITEKKNK